MVAVPTRSPCMTAVSQGRGMTASPLQTPAADRVLPEAVERSAAATFKATEDRMKRILVIIFALAALVALRAASQTTVTVGAVGVYPPGASFGGVPINGLQSGYGVEITGTSALGHAAWATNCLRSSTMRSRWL